MNRIIAVLFLVGVGGCTQPPQSDSGFTAITFNEAYSRRVHEETALHIAARLGDHVRIKRLLGKGADLEACTDYGATPLEFAVRFPRNKQTFDLLIEKGANVWTLDNRKSSLLHVAAAHGKLDIAKFLLVQKLDVNARTARDATPLHMAVANARLPLAQLLVANGAEVNARDILGSTPLHSGVELACISSRMGRSSYLEVLNFILTSGANVRARTTKDAPMTSGVPGRMKAGDTPLAIALRYAHAGQNREVVALLVVDQIDTVERSRIRAD